MAISTMTEPAFIALTVSLVISFGAAAPGISTDAITRSARRHSVSIASLVENTVRTRAPSWLATRRSTSGFRSTTVTVAPIPALISAAWLPATEDHPAGRRQAGNAAGQPAAPAVLLLQAAGADMRRHATRNLRHRHQQRQRALRAGHRLVGDGDDAGGHELGGLLRVGGQVQISEEDLARAELLALRRERLLDLHDQLAPRKDLIRIGCDLGADRTVVGIGQARAHAGVGLDQDLVAVPG